MVGDDYRALCEAGCWTCKHMRIQTVSDHLLEENESPDGPLECQYNPPSTPGFPWVRPEDRCSQHTPDGGVQTLVGPKAGIRPRPPIDEYVDST